MGPINTLQTVNDKINKAKKMRKQADLSFRFKRGESNSVAKKLFHCEDESSNQSQVEEPIYAEDEESQPIDEKHIPQIDVRLYDDNSSQHH